MTHRLSRRVQALEGESSFATIGEMLDSLDGAPLPVGKVVSPMVQRALAGMPNA